MDRAATLPRPPSMEDPTPDPAPSAARCVLAVQSLTRRFGAGLAVDGISFRVERNEIVGLLGPNGAGKTTTIDMILGVLAPSAGTVRVGGLDLATHRAEALAQTSFAAVYAQLPGNLTVRQNLRVFALLYGVPDGKERVEAMLRELDLMRFRDVKCGLLSSGEQARVSLAKALLNQPRLLLLDEPTASLDPSVAREVRARIRDYAAGTGAGVLWTSHNMREVEEVCSRVLFLSRGRILLEGDPRALPAVHGKRSLEDLFVAVAREPLTLEAP